MNWKTFLRKFFRNLVISIVACGVILGLLGYLLAGREGLINMMNFGLIIGVIGGFLSGGVIIATNFWGKKGSYMFLPEWNWFIKNSDDERRELDD